MLPDRNRSRPRPAAGNPQTQQPPRKSLKSRPSARKANPIQASGIRRRPAAGKIPVPTTFSASKPARKFSRSGISICPKSGASGRNNARGKVQPWAEIAAPVARPCGRAASNWGTNISQAGGAIGNGKDMAGLAGRSLALQNKARPSSLYFAPGIRLARTLLPTILLPCPNSDFCSVCWPSPPSARLSTFAPPVPAPSPPLRPVPPRVRNATPRPPRRPCPIRTPPFRARTRRPLRQKVKL